YKGNAPEGACVKVKDGTTLMADGAFENGLHGNTAGITQIVLPDSLKFIPEGAFYNCTGLTSVVIGKNIHSIYTGAFYGCDNLTDIYFTGTPEEWDKIYVSDGDWYWMGEYREYLNNDPLYNAEIHFISKYEMLDGDDSLFDPKSEALPTFRSPAEFGDFEKVEMDGETVAPENYDAVQGSIKIIFKKAFLDSLAPGEHIVSIVASTGVAFAGLEVKATYVAGDLDGQEGVTDADAVYLSMYTFFPDQYPVDQPCDFDGDGSITDADAVYLLMYTFFPEQYPLSK
ncbi:MAG: leucine-rich repeat protein, partial [Oscillospiraceae bacterium]|nr:leucine-rich repeat protein [Candidatus Equicaccousia limihippi]